MLTRRIGKILRGKITPRQIMLAAILGGLLGFVPGFVMVSDLGGGFMQAPALILGLLFLVVILNANLAVFGLTLLAAKLASMALLPVSFAVGRFLLDGPTQGLFELMINAPVLAWCGFEHYATTGGLVMGALFGAVAGRLFLRAVRGFRTRMSGVEEGSERYQKLTSKRSVRFLTWVFLGKGKGKKSYRELLESDKRGLPIRIPGVVLVAVVSVGLWLGLSFLGGPAVRNAMQTSLEHWNGATVDVADASLDLGGGRLSVSGLAIADANDLQRDTFRARTLEMNIGTGDLLAKRFVIDAVTSSEALAGAPRDTPATRVVPPQAPPPPPPAEQPGSKTLEDYLEDAEKWKARLQQVAEWLEVLSGSGAGAEEETPEAREDRIEQIAEESGLARVAATHLIRGAPRVLIRQLTFEGVTAVDLDGDVLDIRARNLSTNPRLVQEPMDLSISSRSGKLSFGFDLDAAGSRGARTAFAYKGLPVDELAGQLSAAPVRGGTIDVALSGDLDFSRPEGPWIDLPLQVTLHDTTLDLEGLGQSQVDELALPLGLRGPLASPRVFVDDQLLADALVQAGRAELANQVRSRADQLLKGRAAGVGDRLGDLVGGDKTEEQLLEEARQKALAEAEAKAEEERQKLEARAREEAAGAIGNVLGGGLLGGARKPALPAGATGHWIHSREEDAADSEVYRRRGFEFPPGGRRGLEIRPDGAFVEHPADGAAVPGRWTMPAEGQLEVEFPGGQLPGYSFRILSVDQDVMRIRR